MSKLEYKCKLKDIQTGLDGKQRIVFELNKNDYFLADKVKDFEEKDLRLGIDIWRERRSLDANAYFHLLVHEIAVVQNIGDKECKIKMNLEYGSPATDENGNKLYVKMPKSVDITQYYDYAKWIKNVVEENGFETSYYLFYKPTHTLDTKEMARLIDGVVREAQEYGIETRTPEELARLKASWGEKDE